MSRDETEVSEHREHCSLCDRPVEVGQRSLFLDTTGNGLPLCSCCIARHFSEELNQLMHMEDPQITPELDESICAKLAQLGVQDRLDAYRQRVSIILTSLPSSLLEHQVQTL